MYVVIENNDRFNIYIEKEEKKGFLWWRRKEKYYVLCNTDGKQIDIYTQNFNYYEFKSLEDANKQIEVFKKPIVLHRQGE